MMEKSKAFQTKKVKRIQHHQTSFTTCQRKFSRQKTREGKALPTENKPQTIMKMLIGSYILIITFNANGLNAPIKRHRLAEQMKTCASMHFHLSHHSA